MRPRWFVPEGIPRPPHLPAGGIGVYAGPGGGPGICVGGPYQPDEPGWLLLDEGWWMHEACTGPEDLLRLSPLDGTDLAGVDPAHIWHVPTLLRPGPGGLVCAVPAVLGPHGYEPPAHLASLLEDLRQVLDRRGWPDGHLLDLAIRIQAVNYHVCLPEMRRRRWISDSLVVQTILYAVSRQEP